MQPGLTDGTADPACCRAAQLIAASDRLQLGSGLLLAVPIPAGQVEEGRVIEAAVQEALQEAERRRLAGSEVRGRAWRAVCVCVEGGLGMLFGTAAAGRAMVDGVAGRERASVLVGAC